MFDLVENMLEATATDIDRKQQSIKRLFPDFDAKTRGVEDRGGIRLSSQDANTWKFKLHSGTGDHWYDGYLHFKNIKPTLEELVKNRKLWVADKSRVDMRKLAREFMDKVDIQLLCSCPADLYWGSHYIRSLKKYGAKYTDPETRSPNIRNPKQYGVMCKHLDRLMHAYPFYQSTCAKWLSNFYGKDIAEWEKEAKQRFGWVRRAVKALVGKRKEKPEEVPEEEREETKESKILTEVEVPVEVLPEPQQKLVDKIGISDRLKRSTLAGEENWRKFWLLSDGSLIPTEYKHTTTAEEAQTTWGKVIKSGGFDGYVYGKEMGGSYPEKLNTEQINTLLNLYYKYQPKSFVCGSFRSRIKNADHLEALLRYGKEFVVEKIEEVKNKVNEIQTTGYVVVGDEKIKLLARPTKYGIALKIRKSGVDGTHFEDEEIFLSENPDLMKKLISGEVINV